MAEYTVNKKVMTGLVFLIGSAIGGLSGCGDDCSSAKSGQLQNGAYLSKMYGALKSNAQTPKYNAQEDGCPSGCSSISDTCCWCP